MHCLILVCAVELMRYTLRTFVCAVELAGYTIPYIGVCKPDFVVGFKISYLFYYMMDIMAAMNGEMLRTY